MFAVAPAYIFDIFSPAFERTSNFFGNSDMILFTSLKNHSFRTYFPYAIALILLAITIFTNTLFFGPKYENSANYTRVYNAQNQTICGSPALAPA
jgi:hypothetical protein